MKLKVQAQHLQAGDIVGSGETIKYVQVAGINLPGNKVYVTTGKRKVLWGKYTLINIERSEKAIEPSNKPSEDSKEYFDRYVAGDR